MVYGPAESFTPEQLPKYDVNVLRPQRAESRRSPTDAQAA